MANDVITNKKTIAMAYTHTHIHIAHTPNIARAHVTTSVYVMMAVVVVALPCALRVVYLPLLSPLPTLHVTA